MTRIIIEEDNLPSWDSFLRELERLKERDEKIKIGEHFTTADKFLFRGQKNSSWNLESTLERATVIPAFQVEDYYSKIYSALPKIEAFTGKSWDWPSLEDAFKDLPHKAKEKKGFPISSQLPVLEYMVYLRHHGFPSPLLDWTRSPFIAAHFAFNNLNKDVDSVSIYAYQEDSGSGKIIGTKGSYIATLGADLRTHQRHFLQQCEYTFCIKIENDEYHFESYHNVKAEFHDQDFLWKFNIPASEKGKVLDYLHSVNINSFSLFQSEEGLMDAIAKESFAL